MGGSKNSIIVRQKLRHCETETRRNKRNNNQNKITEKENDIIQK